MKFSKEYIKECDCEEIRNLEETKIGNWHSVDGEIILHFANGVQFVPTDAKVIWLPTGDQLDEEIVKAMQDIDNYRIGFSKNDCFVSIFDYGLEKYYHRFENKNPLIAKIKLLKQLLKEKG